MSRKIRVGAVSYLNTKPLIYGFEQGMMQDRVDLTIDFPANIAAALLNDTIDIGLVPVAVIPHLKEYHIISDYGIAADGEVASVCLFSEQPIETIQTILLDYQSRTSVALVKVLCKEYWKISPVFAPTSGDFTQQIQGGTAAVVIGDRALAQRNKSTYIYDLADAWKHYTGLPFVFAAWVSNKPMAPEFIKAFNEANAAGLANLDTVIRAHETALFDLKEYYTKHIKFVLNSPMHEAISLFLDKLKGA